MKHLVREVAVKFMPQSNFAKAIWVGSLLAVCLFWVQSAFSDSEQDPFAAFSVIYPVMADYLRRKIVAAIFLTAFFCNMAPVLDQAWEQIV